MPPSGEKKDEYKLSWLNKDTFYFLFLKDKKYQIPINKLVFSPIVKQEDTTVLQSTCANRISGSQAGDKTGVQERKHERNVKTIKELTSNNFICNPMKEECFVSKSFTQTFL